ncbi:PH domain-containing protein [Streptomyces sp. NPDC005962]|uniref:PH domain-containing protein n=1 Tax=Streptomyces sp. NPDC005962 TaxID=3154466 RepID=UPI0034066196
MSAVAQPPALPVTFRPTVTRIVLLTTGAALVVALTTIALLLENLSPGEQLSFVVTGLLFFAGLALFSRPKVVADEAGVTVVNLISSRKLAWAEVLRVNLRPGDAWVHLDLADGTSLPAMGIQLGIAKTRAINDARALRALAEHHGMGGGTS